jgi:hypothetical protein
VIPGSAAPGAVPAEPNGLAEPPDPAAARAPAAPWAEPGLVERRWAEPPPEGLPVLDVESVTDRPGRTACELEPAEPLPLEVGEAPEPDAFVLEPPPRGAVPDPPLPEPPSPDPPDVGGKGTEGTLTAGVDAGPTLTEGTFTGGVDDGAGTLGPTGRSMFAGTAVSVGADASTQTSPASVNSVASVALRKTPAVVIREYPRREL